MLSTIFKSSLAEMAFYMVLGGVSASFLILLIGITFKNRIFRKQAEEMIPKITEEYKVYEAGAELIIDTQRKEIDRYERIQSESAFHASQLVKAIGSK